MSSSRLYYANLLSQANFAGFNVAGGAIANANSGWSPLYEFRAGTSIWQGTGVYAGHFEANYVAEVHQTDAGGTFGGTRWRWSDSGGAVWNASNLIPVSGVPVSVNNGLSLTFTSSGPGPQFVLGDSIQGRALRPYGIAKVLDGSRNSEFRSGTTPASSTVRIGWDFGVATQPGLCVLEDHNLPSSAVVTLFGHGTTLFSETGGGSQVIPWTFNRMSALVTVNPFRYWWIRVVMPSSGQPAYLRLSNLFLGTGVTFALAPSIGFGYDEEWLGSFDTQNVASRGPSPRIYSAAMLNLTWQGRKRSSTEDGGKLEDALTWCRDHASYTMPPMYFLMDDSNTASLAYVGWAGNLGRHHEFLERWTYTTSWIQLIRTVSS